MAEAVTIEWERKMYQWDGRAWSCVTDYTIPPLTVSAQLNLLLARQHSAAEIESFSQRVAAARHSQKPLRVLVTGSRTWSNLDAIRRELSDLPAGSILIHGDAKGADRLAGEVAGKLGWSVIALPADWSKLGKAAGLARNVRMLQDQHPDVVLAFHAEITKPGGGTRHMVELSRKAGLPVRVVAV